VSIATAFSRAEPDPSGPPPPPTAPILIVDDNPGKRLALKAVLAPLGYPLLEAESGAEALRHVLAEDFAVILLDVRMPIMDGFETAAMIRLRTESELTPIIFVTAQAAGEVMVNRYSSGAVDFITAPVDPDELRAKVSVLANLFLQARANADKARELQATADQLRFLTEAAPIGIFQTDTRGRYTYINARWTEITGVSSTDAVGDDWHVMLDDDQRDAVREEFHESYVAGEEFSVRVRLRPRGGAHRIAMLTTRSVLDDAGQPLGWVGTVADVTAEAQAEASLVEARDHATETSRLKSDFLANMSHEIRTPMSGVIGWTELLLETELDADQRVFAQTLSRAGAALLNVINAILDFSKIESGQLDVEDLDFELQTVVDDVVELLAPSAEAKGLALSAVVEKSTPAVVRGDVNRVRQVLTNLAGNAIKFTQSGEIAIRVTADTTDSADTVVRFEVRDTGVGISADKLALIFEPFTQADTSTTRKYGGTGLGLAISGRLAGLMGGKVGVTSDEGTGSVFWFTIGVHHGAQQAAS
jgi:PAS domain S-box-containing protein